MWETRHSLLHQSRGVCVIGVRGESVGFIYLFIFVNGWIWKKKFDNIKTIFVMPNCA